MILKKKRVKTEKNFAQVNATQGKARVKDRDRVRVRTRVKVRVSVFFCFRC